MKVASYLLLWVTAVVVIHDCIGDAAVIVGATNNIVSMPSATTTTTTTTTKPFLHPSRRRLSFVDDEDEQQDTDDYTNGSITNDTILVDQYNNINNNNNDNNYGCDESKCVSTGLEWLFNESFTCYTGGVSYWKPMMCADGYMPRIVENETDAYYYNNSGSSYQYFTCCPPNVPSDADVSRHCSNSTSINVWEDPNNNKTNVVCDDKTKPYHRSMKTRKSFFDDAFSIESYICCDSIIDENENDKSYLNEIECVPYNNVLYETIYVSNGHMYGGITAAICTDSVFHFPKFINYTGNYINHHYECCKTMI
jgi:hypothetical protein